MFIHIKYIILALFIGTFLISCTKAEEQAKSKYSCVTRIVLNWEDADLNSRQNIMLKYSNDSIIKSNGKDLHSTIFNKQFTLMHIAFDDKTKCSNKYKETEYLLKKYLKPISNSPAYLVYKKELKDNEFKGLETSF